MQGITRRTFLASLVLLFACRNKPKPGVEAKSSQVPAQQRLDRFVAELEREGLLNRADLLGGRVVFASEFNLPGYKVYQKDRILDSVNRSDLPYTYKAYLGPNKIDRIYVVIPDEYVDKIENPKEKKLLRAFLFHEFVHVKDRSDIELAKKTSLAVLSRYGIDSREKARRLFLHIGHALSELKANFRMRDFIEKDRSMTGKLQEISDKHLVSWMQAVNNWLLMIRRDYPGVLEDVKKVCVEYIRKEFYASSETTRIEVNQVLKKAKIPLIK